MNIIVPLSNENYYKLCLENILITNELIYKTVEIIGLDNIGIFNILINVLPYPIWIEWFKSCFILKYYLDDELIKKIQDSNKMKINSFLLDLAETNIIVEQNLYEKKINQIQSHLINLTDSYDFNFNFTKDIVKKRINYFKYIFSEYLENFQTTKTISNYIKMI